MSEVRRIDSVSVTADAFSRRLPAELGTLSGDAYDAALVRTLKRTLDPRALASLSDADTERLATSIVRVLKTTHRLPAGAQNERLAGYAVRSAVATARLPAPTPVAVKASPPAQTWRPHNLVPLPPFTAEQTRAPAFIRDVATRLRRSGQDEGALLVDAATRAVTQFAPQRKQELLTALDSSRAEVRYLTFTDRDGFTLAAADGRVAGVVRGRPMGTNDGPALLATNLRAPDDASEALGPTRVQVIHEIDPQLRTQTAATLARRRMAQLEFTADPAWPRGANPRDLNAVTRYFQTLSNSGKPAPELYQRWETYLKTFYRYGGATSLTGSGKLSRFETDMPRIASQLLTTRLDEGLIDCDFFAALTHHVFTHLTKRDGTPRFDAYWVMMEGHCEGVVAERSAGPRAWALYCDEQLWSQGSGNTQAIIDGTARMARYGGPVIFGMSKRYAGAMTAQQTIDGTPAVGAVFYDGQGHVSRVTAVDQRAYRIFKQARTGDSVAFVRSWREYR